MQAEAAETPQESPGELLPPLIVAPPTKPLSHRPAPAKADAEADAEADAKAEAEAEGEARSEAKRGRPSAPQDRAPSPPTVEPDPLQTPGGN